MPNALGHGILFRTDIIQKAGGFPEIVSEDLGLTICLAERGNTGEIATDIVGEEEYPTSYAAYWRRRCRWIQADAELLRIMSGQLAKSQIGLVAKMDLFLRELRLPLGSAYWALLMFAAVCAYWARDLGATLSPVAWIVLIVFLMPALVVLLIKRLTIVERLLYLFCMPFVGAATSAIHPVSTIRGLCKVQEFSSTGSSIRGVGHEKRFLTLWEVITGATVLLCGVLSWQWGLAAIGVAVLLSPFMRSKYEMPLLFVGVVAFWGLLGLQVIIDLFNGSMPMEHILLFSGIAITLE
jgi:cellulose synthase/poly-beta-1,6-N-acetylglucosamine synthase-like glycosyltransferase